MSDSGNEPTIGKLARKWLKQRIGPFGGDPMQNSQREAEAVATEDELKRRLGDETQRKIAAAVLPSSWNERIEAARPENRAARAATAHRQELEAGDKAHLELTLSGGVSGTVDALVALDVDFDSDDGVWRIELEPIDPIPVGGTDFRRLVFIVPTEALEGPCDLARWTVENEDRYDPIDFECQLGDTGEPQQWTESFGSAPVQVIGSNVVLSLPTQDPSSRAVNVDASVECPEGTFDQAEPFDL